MGLSGRVADIPRYHESQLQVGTEKVLPTGHDKLEAIADDSAGLQPTGRPQLILAHENDLVAKISALLNERGGKHNAIDARWFLERGVDAEADLQRITDEAGEPGKVTVINMQGARGVDIPIGRASQDLGGLHVAVTARSAVSRDIDIQAENRAARNGQPGGVQYYVAPDDHLVHLEPHEPAPMGPVRHTQPCAPYPAQPPPARAAEVA